MKIIYIIPIIVIILLCGAYANILNTDIIINDNTQSANNINETKDMIDFKELINSNQTENILLSYNIPTSNSIKTTVNNISTKESSFLEFANSNSYEITEDSIKFNGTSIYTKFPEYEMNKYSSALNKKIIVYHEDGSDTYYPSQEDMINEMNAKAGGIKPTYYEYSHSKSYEHAPIIANDKPIELDFLN
ncbi:hypothetical protein [Methanobrevibacter millerae]|uniref:Uncharacterized protein n=1 Tax=Methanobrevibacter millerae TaxID=230361 RepID=A0A1G5WS58_9EURY|nr:hypothetical protein [Methanobrevibacter millerae]SDA60135.1 hypothetical protein SAMN02910315_01578 [Methanobrevibacter millerae]